MIGKEFSHNMSPTLRAKLIAVGDKTCLFEVAKSPYKQMAMFDDKVGNVFSTPTSIVDTIIFGR